MVVVRRDQRSARRTELQQLEEIDLPPQHVEGHPAVAVKRDPLVRVPGDATEGAHPIERAVVEVVRCAAPRRGQLHGRDPNALRRAERDRVADLRRSRILLPGRQHPPAFLVPARSTEGVLREVARVEVAHLQEVADVDVLGCHPPQDQRVLPGRTSQVNVVVRGIPTQFRHRHPALELVSLAQGAAGIHRDTMLLADEFVAFRQRDAVSARRQLHLEPTVDVERAVRLRRVPTGRIVMSPHDREGLLRHAECLARYRQRTERCLADRLSLVIRDADADWRRRRRTAFQDHHAQHAVGRCRGRVEVQRSEDETRRHRQ